MGRWRSPRIVRAIARIAVYAAALALVVVLAAVLAAETPWGKDQLRRLLVRQANDFLTATLEIGDLDGSLFRGLRLREVRLTRGGQRLITIGEVALSYSIRELVGDGTTIRELRLVDPVIAVKKGADGRWNLATLVRREAREEERRGPGRPIGIESLVIRNGAVTVGDPVTFGVARVPRRYEHLNVRASFRYVPVGWELDLERASWSGGDTDLTMKALQGGIANGRTGWTFDDVSVETPRSSFVFSGRVTRGEEPTTLDLEVDADRFAFQEWALVVPELRNIAIEASFETRLRGPLARLETDIQLHSNGGSVRGGVVLNTRVPGWRGAGTVDVHRLDLAPWFSRPDRPSDISGRVTFDLVFGRRFPRGSYDFDGTHAAYLGYEADDVRARGTLTADRALIDAATATAYGANVSLRAGSIGINRPYPFVFRGLARGVDLRLVPANVPVPHVESSLSFEYDVTGQFTEPFITGGARFEDSVFLGAAVGAGAVGSIDTNVRPYRYSGEGDVAGIDLNHFGRALEVAWLQDPRYDGTVSGRFHVNGAGGDLSGTTLIGGGRLTRADLFGGMLSDAEVAIEIAAGTLAGSYDGRLEGVNPAIAFNDPRFEASLTGEGRARTTVRELLLRSPALDDYSIAGDVTLRASTIRGIAIDSAAATAILDGGVLDVSSLMISAPALEGTGSGEVAFSAEGRTRFAYDVHRVDLAALPEGAGVEAAGRLSTKGAASGTAGRLRLLGNAEVSGFEVAGVRAANVTAEYDVDFPTADPARATADVDARLTLVEMSGQTLNEVAGTTTYSDGRLDLDVSLTQQRSERDLEAAIAGTLLLDTAKRTAAIPNLAVTLEGLRWHLAAAARPPTVSWTDDAVAVDPSITFVDSMTGAQRIEIGGSFREDGTGALRVTARGVYLDNLWGSGELPARYGGVLDLDAVVSGTRDDPRVTSRLTVVDGRIRRLSYDRFGGRIDYADGMFDVDVRLDQAPGVWLTAAGDAPLALFDRDLPERPMKLAVASSSIGLGLIEGVTDVVRDVSGDLRLNVTAIGTTRDPHFTGTVDLTNAAFTVVSTGARYSNGRMAVRLQPDRISVNTLQLEDRQQRRLDVRGSLGTHELTIADLAIDVAAQGFEVLRNEFGTVNVDAKLTVGGQFETPRIEGRVAIASGELDIDSILDRTLFQPYATEAAPAPAAPTGNMDAVAALNPWERLGLNIELHVPGTLSMSGDDVQVTAGTPIGLGDIDLRVLGDLYLYKDPGQPLYVNGSFDQVTGTYTFQGRRFEIDPTSSINFRGDLNPELYVTVKREISSVETRVTIAGPLREPELRLASTPPLDSTDILSLIVFNAASNQLTSAQQRELAVRAGTLAAGFLAQPLVSALERTLGLDILEIEASDEPGNVARVTVGDEIAPGLVARFSRQFGDTEYDEAAIEYYLSNLFRIRATFSDAGTLIRRSPFRRVETAAIDLLIYFSF